MKEKTPYDLLMEYERSKRPRRATEPVKRSWIKPKRREKKTLWRTDQVKEDSKGMATLRSEAYQRSGGKCECGCGKEVTWSYGHLHHVTPRSRGGSDILANVKYITPPCHKRIHGEPEWTRPLLPEFKEVLGL